MVQQQHCHNCGKLFTPCRRVKNQKYCSNPVCQQARKSLWHKQKLVNDKNYRANQEDAKRRWRENNSDYWGKYRDTHPEYTKRNREMQRIRNRKKRQNCSLQKLTRQPIAKMDALNGLSTQISGKYMLTPVQDTGIAKMDTIFVQITGISPQFAESG